MIKEDKSHIVVDNLLYSCVDQKQRGHEQFVPEHALGYIISGETHLITNAGVKIFKAGSVGLVRRNQLIKSLKVPPPGGEFKSLNIFLDQAFLRKYSIEHKIDPVGKYTGEYMKILAPDPFLKGYFDSLVPYFDHPEQLKSSLGDLKSNEAVQLLLRHDAGLKDFFLILASLIKLTLRLI